MVNFDSALYARADTLSTLKASDHANISASISCKSSTTHSCRTIPLEMFNSYYYKHTFHIAVHLHPWHEFPLSQFLGELKELIEDVAAHTKEFLFSKYVSCTWASLQKLVTRDQDARFMQH